MIGQTTYVIQGLRIWTAKDNPRVYVDTDGEKFLATIQAGMDCENYLTVGYSDPNYADMEVCEFAQAWMADKIQAVWDETEQKKLDEMLPALLRLAKAANKAYNDALDSYLESTRDDELVMDTLSAFARGQAAQGQPQRTFDWLKAAKIIKERQPSIAEAGLIEDWGYTGGRIWEDSKPVSKDDTYTYLSSNWATPTLILDGVEIECWVHEDDTDWGPDTYWPPEALAELE